MTAEQRYEARKRELIQEEKEFLSKHQDPTTGKLVNIPVQGRTQQENSITERLQYAISNDPRSRFEGESTEDVVQRRKAGYLAEEQERVNQPKIDYEKILAGRLTSMNLEPSYRVHIPDWAIDREDNEE